MFDGSVYTGEVAHQIGFVDELGEMRTVLQRRYGRYERLESAQRTSEPTASSRVVECRVVPSRHAPSRPPTRYVRLESVQPERLDYARLLRWLL